MLTNWFEQLLSMSLTALPVIAVVLTVRWLLRRAPKKYTYFLWLVIAFRLVCPVALESPVGLVQTGETSQQIAAVADTYIEPTLTYRDNGGFTPDYEVLLNRGYTPNEQGEIVTNEAGTREAWQVRDLLSFSSGIWLAGMAAMVAYLVLSTLRLCRQVAAAVRRAENIWECDSISTPFVLGLFRPRIYIPFRIAEAERTYILSHERYHIRHGDPWAKVFALFLLTVYWWNPAVWLCWALFCRDMEMRCDEAVLEELGTDVKRDYSLSLLSFALDRRAPMALAFGEHDAAKRIKHVLKWKQAKPAVVFLAVSAVILVALICGTNASSTSWVKVEKKPAENGGIQFTWNLKDPIRSWAIYEDVYEDGKLISSSPRILDGFQEDGNGTSDRRETISLSVFPTRVESGAGFSSQLQCSWSGVGGGNWTLELPKDSYYAMGMTPREGHEATFYNKIKLSPNDSAVLYSIALNQGEGSGITLYNRDHGLSAVNDTVVQYRLVTSTRPYSEFTIEDSASALYRMRTASAKDTERVQALLTALGADQWGEYTIDSQPVGSSAYLLLSFDSLSISETALLDETWDSAYLLTALIGNIEGVKFAYTGKQNQQEVVTVIADEDWQNELILESTGYPDIKTMGKTPGGVRTLMEYLDWQLTTAEAEAPALFEQAQSQSAKDFAETIMDAHLWGYGTSFHYMTTEWLTDTALHCFWNDTPSDPDARDTTMVRRSAVLMRLYPQVEQVTWHYYGKGSEKVQREFYREELGMILALSSNLQATAPVTSADNMEALLRFLGALDEKLFVSLAQEGNAIQIREPKTIASVLIGREEAEGLLDHYIPWDLYVDPDTWEDESINEFGAYVYYYGLSRAQFRQFIESLSTIPVELQGVELEGNEADTANITLSGHWTRTELEKIGDKAVQRKEMEEIAQWPGALYEVMDFPAYVVTEESLGGAWNLRTYYTLRGGGPMKIAETFGFGEAEDYIVDLDGDGVTELVANVTFGGDGARRVYVYQRRGNDIYLGVLDPGELPAELLPNYESGGEVSWWSEYRPDSGSFRLHYAQKGSEDMGLLETYDLSLLTFIKFSG